MKCGCGQLGRIEGRDVKKNRTLQRREGAAPKCPINAAWLEFAKGYGHWAGCRADCWRQTADNAHNQGEDDAAYEEAAGDLKGEGHIAEGLPVHGGGG
jgi:hypothetical protein